MPEDQPAAAVFADRGHAARAADELRRAGFEEQNIGFAMQQRTGMGPPEAPGQAVGDSSGLQGERATDDHSAPGGSGTVAVLAGLLGEAAAGLAPGVGPIFAGGILSELVTGTPTATSGIARGLVEAGIPEDEAEWHETAIEQGRVLLVVRAGTRGEEAAALFERTGGSCFEARQIAVEQLPAEEAGG